MLKLDFSADVTGASEYLNMLRAQRARKAIAEALNKTAMSARDAVRKDMPDRFTIRRPWVLRGIGIRLARTGSLEAAVFSRDEFMRDQEYGGVRRGRSSQIIPRGRMAAIKRSRVLPKSLHPKALWTREDVFYRNGKLFERRDNRRIELLYQFRKEAKIPQRFGMEQTVRCEVLRTMQREFELELMRALAK